GNVSPGEAATRIDRASAARPACRPFARSKDGRPNTYRVEVVNDGVENVALELVADSGDHCADGGEARRCAARRRRLAVRAEVGRISLPRVSQRHDRRAAREIGQVALALLPRDGPWAC